MRVVHDSKTIAGVKHLHKATRIMAESGILYTLTSILTFAALWSPNNTFGKVVQPIVRPSIVYFASNNHYSLLFRTSQWQGLRSISS